MIEPGVPPGLIDRVKNILLKPSQEWDRIDTEPATVSGIYQTYVLPLAAIPAVAGLIGALVFGYSALGITWRPSVLGAISAAVVQYLVALASVFIFALIIDALAPTFLATKNRIQALKVAAYSATAGWIAGIVGLFPSLSIIAILGSLYGLYLLYLGLPKLMKAPAEKALPYTITSIVVAIVLSFVLALVVAPIAAIFGGGVGSMGSGAITRSDDSEVSGSVTVPGVGKIDLGELQNATDQMQRAQNGEAPRAVSPSVLQALLPGTLAGLSRASIESSSAGAGGVGASRAEARYGEGERSVTLEITDMAAMGGLAALGSAFNVESSRTTDTGYERIGTVDGRMTTEKWDSGSREGTYGVVIASRFLIEAEGHGVDMDALKAAVGGIDAAALENAARQ